MHSQPAEITIDRQQSLGDISLAVRSLGVPAGLVCLAAAGGLSLATADRGIAYFLNAYLIAFMFFLSISLGCLFIVLVSFITRSGWNAGLRRVAEMVAMGLFPMMILFAPIALLVIMGNSDLYRWNDAKYMQSSELLSKKLPFLNAQFFVIRYGIYAVVLCGLARYFFRTSLAQDKTGDPALTLQMERTSTWGAFLFAFALTFAAVDWMMTLDPEWYSTIFGVNYFAGGAVAAHAFLIVATMTLQSRGLLKNITVEHFHDLAKLMFGFTCFWAYTAFSQYFLIWYANIPEETKFFLFRQGGQELQTGWPNVSLALIIGCFILPFVGMMARGIRRNRNMVFFWALFILATRYLDMYWIIRPNYQPKADVLLGPTFGLVDVLCLIGIGGIWLGSVVFIAGRHPIVAIGDPRLKDSLRHKVA
ncbi:quinol:cytochrome C oxidoreductase [bacterium]|jgi:hypothetical protein|nr:quinol:cytochrome C oxidoreductase [bacterium]